MSKFNTRPSVATSLETHPSATTNYEGDLAFTLTPHAELYLRAATALMGEPRFYEDADQSDAALALALDKVLNIDPEFVLQLAVHCRENLYLRSVPLFLITEFANAPCDVTGCGTPQVKDARKYITRVIQRADELTELIALQLNRNKFTNRRTKLPMMIKKGVADAFNKFNEYHFAKYNRKNEVKLLDVMRMVHPKPKDEAQSELYRKIRDDALATSMTWEVMRSTGKMSWHDVINNIFAKGNYMAMLRNLKNMIKDDSVTDADINLVASKLRNKELVNKSRQFPFRFLSAYKMVQQITGGGFHTNVIMSALEDAVIHSTANMPHLSGNTLIACDVSASMYSPISQLSNIKSDKFRSSMVQNYDIGLLMGMLAHRFCDSTITGIFGSRWKPVALAKNSGVLANTDTLRSIANSVGTSTNGHLVIKYLNDNNIKADRIFMFSDYQIYRDDMPRDIPYDFIRSRYHGKKPTKSFAEEFTNYQRNVNPDVYLYAFNMGSYGTSMIPENTKNVLMIGGWSDKIFSFIPAFESDYASAVDEIKRIKP